MVGNGFSCFLRHGHRGSQAGKWLKMAKMAEKSSPRLFGRKWCFRAFCAIFLLLRNSFRLIMIGQFSLISFSKICRICIVVSNRWHMIDSIIIAKMDTVTIKISENMKQKEKKQRKIGNSPNKSPHISLR